MAIHFSALNAGLRGGALRGNLANLDGSLVNEAPQGRLPAWVGYSQSSPANLGLQNPFATPVEELGQLRSVLTVPVPEVLFGLQSQLPPHFECHGDPSGILEGPIRRHSAAFDHIPFLLLLIVIMLQPNKSLRRNLKSLANLKAKLFDAICNALTRITRNFYARNDNLAAR